MNEITTHIIYVTGNLTYVSAVHTICPFLFMVLTSKETAAVERQGTAIVRPVLLSDAIPLPHHGRRKRGEEGEGRGGVQTQV